jgi:uncharacterized protein
MTNFANTSPKLLTEQPVKRSWAATGVTALIRGYQKVTANRVSPCRFYPSCSQYAAEAVEIHGAIKGLGLSIRRISRCRPLGPHGVDLVPLPEKPRSQK